MVKVMLVDDDTDLLDVAAYAMRREGFDVIVATDGQQAMQRFEQDHPDVLVLDVNMPWLSGLEVCQRVRRTASTSAILLTALNQEEQVLLVFQAGADDYVTKPFSPRQRAMRIRAVWRRSAARDEPEPVRELRLGTLVLDAESHDVCFRNRPIQLTPIEFRLLYILAANGGRVVSNNRLVDYVWGYDGGDISLLKAPVSHLRRKLDLPNDQLGEIGAIPRVGYRLTRQVAAS